MAQRSNFTGRAADTTTLPDLDQLRQKLLEIEDTLKKAEQGKIDVKKLQEQTKVLQNESKEALSQVSVQQLHAGDHYYNVAKRRKEIEQVIKALKEAESVDVCFMMDCTNSMIKYIDQVKQYIFNTIQLLKVRFPQLNLRLAFVGYRDRNLSSEKQFSILDFTDAERFYQFVSDVACAWGSDYCEDVLGGLEKVTQLRWKQPVRIMLHIGDAPPHGRRYHDLEDSADNYLTDDKCGSIGYSHIQELIQLNVKYFFGRLTSYTDKMIEQFRTHAENKLEIEMVDLNKFENLLPFIVESISKSISTTTSSLLRDHALNGPKDNNEVASARPHNQRTILLDKTEPVWMFIRSIRAKVIKYQCDGSLQCTEIEQVWNIKIAEKPFSEGALRIAYYGLMEYRGSWEKAVLKEYKRIAQGANTKDKYLEDIQCQTIADHLAQKFNELPELRGLTTYVRKIKFIMTKLIFLPIGQGKYRNMSIEKFIEGSYKKYSNNAGFVEHEDPSFTLQAFSHWTHQYTKGELMVVDLQGLTDESQEKYLLTDPCLHSTDVTRFGRTNLGKEGMKRFFETHVCNIICHALKLDSNKYQPDIKAMNYDSYFVKKPNRTMFN